MLKIILFITHKKSQCWVYEFWKNISDELIKSKKYKFIRVECWNLSELKDSIKKYNPSAIIYNYHPSVMSWLTRRIIPIYIYRSNIINIKIPQIWIIHEVTEIITNKASFKKQKYIFKWSSLINTLFDYYIAPDPTIKNKNNIFTTGRLIPLYKNIFPIPNIPTIWSFWFWTSNKWFEKIVEQVQKEFNEAIINFNIPFADYWDRSWENAKIIANNCENILKNKNIQLNITHNFFTKNDMLDFLAKNTINIFLYQNPSYESRWISSVIENALAVQRPICISKSLMFRHVINTQPSICIDDSSIKNIIENWFDPLRKYYELWNSKNIVLEYENIINNILFNK